MLGESVGLFCAKRLEMDEKSRRKIRGGCVLFLHRLANFYLSFSDDILRTDGFVIHHAADGFGKHGGNAQLLYFIALLGVRDAVREYHFRQGGLLDAERSRIRHHAVAGDGAHRLGACIHHDIGGFGDGAGRIHNVVHQNDLVDKKGDFYGCCSFNSCWDRFPNGTGYS